jgi:hypothetical protein
MGEEQSRHAAQERADGYVYAASARYLRAATYHLTGERQTPPGPAKTHSYTAALKAFAHGVELMPRPTERVEVESPDGILPGYLIPSGTDGPAPVVIFYNGLLMTKISSALGADHIIARATGSTGQIRRLVPGGVPGLVDAANLGSAALPAIADGGEIVTVRGWSGPAERGITVHPVSAFASVTDTTLLEELRDLAEDGTLSLRVADVMPARYAAEAHRRLAAGGIRGRIVLDFETSLIPYGISRARPVTRAELTGCPVTT